MGSTMRRPRMARTVAQSAATDVEFRTASRPPEGVRSGQMARLQRKFLSNPDEIRSFTNGRVEIFTLDDVDVGLQVFAPGWRWSTDVKPIAGTALCMYHHMGYVLSGAAHVEMEDGLSLEIPARSLF